MRTFTSRRRKAFTLVELLIVIVVIGILSAMMMLSSSEAVSSAKATAIISDLRSLKTAALAYFADHADVYITSAPTAGSDAGAIEIDDILQYLNGKDIPNKAAYKLIPSDNKDAWFVECNVAWNEKSIIKGTTERTAVKNKLAGRAKSVGLLADKKIDSEVYDGKKGYSTGGNVFMLVQ